MHHTFWSANLRGRVRGKLRSRWEDNIKMYIKEMKQEGIGWIHLTRIVAKGKLL
jgi:hypothetical protein